MKPKIGDKYRAFIVGTGRKAVDNKRVYEVVRVVDVNVLKFICMLRWKGPVDNQSNHMQISKQALERDFKPITPPKKITVKELLK